MQPRKLMLTVLAGGPVLGLLMGLAVNPGMTPPAEPAWRSAKPDPIFTQPQRFVEAGPEALSPLITERTPTWKRHPAQAQAVAYRDDPEPTIAPAAEALQAEPAVDDAAAETNPARDAQAAPGAEAAAAQDQAPQLVIVRAGA